MRKIDKTKNILKANLLVEQRYLESKGLIKENVLDENDLNESDRVNFSEYFGDIADDVNSLLKMFSKHQPKNGWFMTVGYVNNADLNIKIPNNKLMGLEAIARKLGHPAFIAMVDSPEWKDGINKGSIVKNPFAKQKPRGKEEIAATVYTTKKFMLQWKNTNIKPEKDAAVKAVYDKYGLDWESGKINPEDKRGLGWSPIEGTPFKQHDITGTKALSYYIKQDISKGIGETKYFLKFKDNITELSKDEVKFIYSLSPKTKSDDGLKRLSHLPIEAAKEIKKIEDLYSFKNLNLDKIMYIKCSMVIDGENKKFSYINYNVVPHGLKQGEFKEFIEASVSN